MMSRRIPQYRENENVERYKARSRLFGFKAHTLTSPHLIIPVAPLRAHQRPWLCHECISATGLSLRDVLRYDHRGLPCLAGGPDWNHPRSLLAYEYTSGDGSLRPIFALAEFALHLLWLADTKIFVASWFRTFPVGPTKGGACPRYTRLQDAELPIRMRSSFKTSSPNPTSMSSPRRSALFPLTSPSTYATHRRTFRLNIHGHIS